jgi:hypothetical protein
MTRIHDHGQDDPLEFTPQDTPDEARMWLAQRRFEREVARLAKEGEQRDEANRA